MIIINLALRRLQIYYQTNGEFSTMSKKSTPGRLIKGRVTDLIEVRTPDEQTLPVVYSSPHSGTAYAQDFLAASPLDLDVLRQSEDAFVDELFSAAPKLGAPLLCAHFPRVYVDPNREPYELDPHMFDGALPAYANTSSARVTGGLGTIARVVSNGAEIYRDKLPVDEAKKRIDLFYSPYHKALKELLAETKDRFGYAILVDCHSMPSIAGPLDEDLGHERADFVLGDRFGESCAPIVTKTVQSALKSRGYKVFCNNPYAGGFITHNYGRRDIGVHALQIEINREMYMDEETVERKPGIDRVKEHMSDLISLLGTISALQLKP